MIGRIAGTLLEKQAPDILVDCQGVGYELQVPLNTFFELPEAGDKVSLHTHFVVREDAQLLFGFASRQERALFRTLIKVSGVGPKMALAILSGMSVSDFVRCVQTEDTAALVRMPGVGKKTAERLLVEMKDRIGDWDNTATAAAPARPTAGNSHWVQEAESALIALGYKPQEAARLVNAVVPENTQLASSEELIRLALQSTVKK